MRWTYFGPWDWLGMFWNVIACFWKAQFVEFGSTTMGNGFNSQFVASSNTDEIQKVFFSVDQTGTADGQVNLASITTTDGGLVVVCDAATPTCKVDWVSIG